jgi:hypothetical protein
MEYNKIVSVTGLSGLFEMISSKAGGAVVRSLEDNTSKFVSSRIHNFSHLESIEIYTVKDNVNLVEVFAAMKASSEAKPEAAADAAAIKAYFGKVYPDMDFERVYVSDMKKMIRWFAILDGKGIDMKLSSATAETDAAAPAQEEVKPEKPKATRAKSGAAKQTSAPAKKVNAPRKMA